MNDFLLADASLSLHHLTVLDATPLELIEIAGTLRCDHVCLFTHVPEEGRQMFPSVGRADIPVVREALDRAGVSLCNIEFFPIDGKPDYSAFEEALAVGQALGATKATVHVHGLDDDEAVRWLRDFCDRAAPFGIVPGLEPNAFSAVRSVAHATALIRRVERDNLAMVCDALHLVRSDGSVADVADASTLIGYFQICDGPLEIADGDRWHEAIFERGIPGTGAFPLREALPLLQPGTVIDVEVPQKAARKAGVTGLERARRAVDATRSILASLDQKDASL